VPLGSAWNNRHRTVDDELGDNDRKGGNALEGKHEGNGNGFNDPSCAVPSRPQSLHPGL
jgi:hypothetical protein